MSSLLDLKSNAEQRPSASSVFDFLYNDSERVASFLGQFDPNGHLTGLKTLLSVGEGTSSTSDISGAGSIGVMKGAMKAVDASTEDHRRGAESTYDPLWANALSFLEHLSAHDMIERDLWNARIGQFVLVKGYLTILDVSILRAAWGLPTVQAIMKSGVESDKIVENRHQRRANGGKKQISQATEIDVALELLGIMPHLIQARLLGEGFYAWSSLKEDRLVTSAGDLLLKHGMRIQGEWAMLGILDAHPQLGASSEAPEADPAMGVASMILSHLAPAARTMLGRPDLAHGVTPLLIFREINSDKQSQQ